jgi:hypothetical protein
MGYSKKARIIAVTFNNHVFMNERSFRKGGVNSVCVHELIHLVDTLAGVKRKPVDIEVLSNTISLFIESEVSGKRNEKMLSFSNSIFSNKYLEKEYSEGTNKGREIFLIAQRIREEKGRKAAIAFIQDLFSSTTLSEYAVNNAEAYARKM